MNARFARLSAAALLLGGLAAAPTAAFAHGDVTPQAVDISGLEPLGKEWRDSNPYRGNERAIEIGKSAFNQNCARCHGLGAVSGGIGAVSEPGGTGGVSVYMRVDDLQASLDRAETLGGKALVPPTDLPDGYGRFAMFADPDGNSIGLWA